MNTFDILIITEDYFKKNNYINEKPTGLISEFFPDTFNPSAAHEQVMDLIQMKEEISGYRDFYVIEECFRNIDLSRVGLSHHNAFFQMFAYVNAVSRKNFCKEKVIKEAIDFLKYCLKIDINKIVISVFGGGAVKNLIFEADKESYSILMKLGIAEDKIVSVPTTKNFLYLQREGDAAGPRCEIFFDRGEEYIENRYIEIGSIIFEDHYFSKGMLVRSINVIAGAAFGVERLSMVLNDNKTIYDTDLFKPLINYLESQIKNKKLAVLYNFEINALADYLRSICFILISGQRKENTQRGRILKKLYALLSKKLDLFDINHPEIIKKLIDILGETHYDYYAKIYKNKIILTDTILENIQENKTPVRDKISEIILV